MTALSRDVRYTPNSGHSTAVRKRWLLGARGAGGLLARSNRKQSAGLSSVVITANQGPVSQRILAMRKQKESAPKLVNEPQVEASEMEFSAKEEELFRRLLKVRNLPMAQDEQPEPEGIAMQNEMLR
jgi:hypothetical protein